MAGRRAYGRRQIWRWRRRQIDHDVNATVDLAQDLVDRRRRSGKLPPLVLGVGDALGFGADISPAKLAAGDGLDEVGAGFELRVHGVGGSSPEQLLEQPETVQVGGDDIAQFVRRWLRTGTSKSAVPWPLEGYWWGGLTSRPSTRAFWVLLIPLMLCNVATWMIPTTARKRSRQRLAGAMLPPLMRLAGLTLTLLLTASLMTAITDVFGWQCAGTFSSTSSSSPAARSGSLSCLPGWLGWAPAAPGPRLVVFTLIPVLVLSAIGYACHRTLRAYERWTLPDGLPEDRARSAKRAARSWPLTADGFWHGLRPVRRQQLLHLATAAALITFYLADVRSSHPGVRTFATGAALVLLVVPALMLLLPRTGRPGVNPHSGQAADMDVTAFDRWCGLLLGVSVAALAGSLVARIWWRPIAPTAVLPMRVGLMPGDAAVWWALTLTMGGLVLVAFLLTAMALDPRSAKPGERRERTFAGGFMAPLVLGLACVSGGIFAGGLNLLLPSLLIGSKFRNIGPALPGSHSAGYPLVLPVPVFGFMTGLLFLTAAAVVLVLVGLCWFIVVAWKKSKVAFLQPIYDRSWDLHKHHTRRQRWSIAVAWTEAEIADHVGVAAAALSVAEIAGVVVFDVLALVQAGWLPLYWVTTLAHVSQWLGLAVAAGLYAYTRQAFTDRGKRRIIGVLWDVGTFWPRASQPLAPPCYMERAIPETVNRLRRALGDRDRISNKADQSRPGGRPLERPDPATDPYENDYIRRLISQGSSAGVHKILLDQEWVLLNGYSQGSPIAAAIIAQLPQPLRDKVYLVTVGSPLRRLYGRAFPAYFGERCMLELANQLVQGEGTADKPGPVVGSKAEVLAVTRWRNMRRPSDYIGSYIFSEPLNKNATPQYPVDQLVLDPPRIIPARATTPPPIHKHSAFWPDPRVAVLTQELLGDRALAGQPRSAPYASDRHQRSTSGSRRWLARCAEW